MVQAIHFIFFAFAIGWNDNPIPTAPKTESTDQRPQVAFTFDDGFTRDMANFKLEEWNEMILASLAKHNAKSVLFANVGPLQNAKGKYVLSSWNNAGHKIANHT